MNTVIVRNIYEITQVVNIKRCSMLNTKMNLHSLLEMLLEKENLYTNLFHENLVKNQIKVQVIIT